MSEGSSSNNINNNSNNDDNKNEEDNNNNNNKNDGKIKSSSNPHQKNHPRGILKNKPGSQEPRSPHLTWDEPNLALNDLNRDSKMKITEPKTPFVRYNAETDEVMNIDAIPEFDLAGPSGTTSSPTGNQTSEDESSRSSRSRRFSSNSTRRGSDSTERRQVLLQAPARPPSAVGDDDDDEDDEELDPETKAKHDAFVRARKGHYGNEAEAMKRARELAEREESEIENSLESDPNTNDNLSESSPKLNGEC